MKTQNQYQSCEPITTHQKTLGSVLGQKILAWFERTPAGKILAFIVVGYAVAYPESALTLAKNLLSANEYFAAKMLAAGVAINKWRLLYSTAKKIYRFLKRIFKKKGHAEIEGIPVYEILHQLFYRGSFKREEILKKWEISQSRYNAIAQKLESLHILTRGENNSRVLNPEFTREQVAEILREADGRASRIRLPLNIFHFGKKTKQNAQEVKESVRIAIAEEDSSEDTEIPVTVSPSSPPLSPHTLNLRKAAKA